MAASALSVRSTATTVGAASSSTNACSSAPLGVIPEHWPSRASSLWHQPPLLRRGPFRDLCPGRVERRHPLQFGIAWGRRLGNGGEVEVLGHRGGQRRSVL